MYLAIKTVLNPKPLSSFSGELLDLVHGSCGELVTVVAEKANGLWLHVGPIPRADAEEQPREKGFHGQSNNQNSTMDNIN